MKEVLEKLLNQQGTKYEGYIYIIEDIDNEFFRLWATPSLDITHQEAFPITKFCDLREFYDTCYCWVHSATFAAELVPTNRNKPNVGRELLAQLKDLMQEKFGPAFASGIEQKYEIFEKIVAEYPEFKNFMEKQ